MRLVSQYKIKQHFALTPQLQEAIKLMQLSALELQHEIQKTVTENPLLENPLDNLFEPLTSEILNNQEDIDDNEIDACLLTDIYNSSPLTPWQITGAENEIPDEKMNTLTAYLQWQLNLTRLSEKDHAIGLLIIDSINDEGFLTANYPDIAEGFANTLLESEFNNILKLIQHFDPFGTASRSRGEFLKLQCDEILTQLSLQLNPVAPGILLAKKILDGYLLELAGKDYKWLAKHLNVTIADIENAVSFILTLHTKPEIRLFETESIRELIPDVVISKENHSYHLTINKDINKVFLNQDNIRLLQSQETKKEVNNYLKDKLRSAKWFLKCLNHREKILLKVCRAILLHQLDFLEKGMLALKPLTMKQIALSTHFHESTISRVIQNKTILTPRGIFPIKYFFASHLDNDLSSSISQKQVIARLKTIIARELPENALSDQQIANKLKRNYGLQVARRTITKYRHELGILPANIRQKISIRRTNLKKE